MKIFMETQNSILSCIIFVLRFEKPKVSKRKGSQLEGLTELLGTAEYVHVNLHANLLKNHGTSYTLNTERV